LVIIIRFIEVIDYIKITFVIDYKCNFSPNFLYISVYKIQ